MDDECMFRVWEVLAKGWNRTYQVPCVLWLVSSPLCDNPVSAVAFCAESLTKVVSPHLYTHAVRCTICCTCCRDEFFFGSFPPRDLGVTSPFSRVSST